MEIKIEDILAGTLYLRYKVTREMKVDWDTVLKYGQMVEKHFQVFLPESTFRYDEQAIREFYSKFSGWFPRTATENGVYFGLKEEFGEQELFENFILGGDLNIYLALVNIPEIQEELDSLSINQEQGPKLVLKQKTQY